MNLFSSLINNLSDLDLINNVFEFFYKIRKINDDIENISGGYEEIKNAYIDKKIPVKQYVINGLLVADNLDLVKDFQE